MEGHPQIPLEPWVSGSDLDVETLACYQARGGDRAVLVVVSVKMPLKERVVDDTIFVRFR